MPVSKPPSRRQIAAKVLDIIPAVNAQGAGLDALQQRLAIVEARPHLPLLPWRQRLAWIFGR